MTWSWSSGSASWFKVTQTDVTLQSYYYQDGFLQQQDTGYPSAGETRRAMPAWLGGWVQLPIDVEGVLHLQHELGMEFRHRGWCRMGHKTLMATAKLSPLTEHIHAFSCFQWWPLQLAGLLTGLAITGSTRKRALFHHSRAFVGFQLRSIASWAWLPDDAEGSNLRHHLVVKLNGGLPRNQVQTTYVAADCVVFPSRTANHVVVGRKNLACGQGWILGVEG